MPVTPRGSSWQASVSHKGKRARADFPTKAEAEAWHADALAALLNSRAIPASQRRPEGKAAITGMPIHEALKATERGRWAQAKSAAKLSLCGEAVVRYFGHWRDIATITTSDIARMQRDLTASGDGPATVNRKVSALGAMFREAEVRTDFRVAMPRFPQRLDEGDNGRQAILLTEQVEAVAAWLRRVGDTETADLVEVLYWSGIRMGEAERLNLSDVVTPQVGRGFLRVINGTKSGKPRDVPIVKQLQATIQRRRAEIAEQQKVVPYLNRKGVRLFPGLRPYAALRAFQRACRALGIEGDDICLHTLRHSCGSRLMREGVQPRIIMDWMGHSTPSMMVRYSRVMSADLAAAADKLDAG
jgi:integrase